MNFLFIYFQFILYYYSLILKKSDIDFFQNIFLGNRNSTIDNETNKSNIFKFELPDDYSDKESNQNNLNIFIVIYCLKLEGKGLINEWNTKLYINDEKRKFIGLIKKIQIIKKDIFL